LLFRLALFASPLVAAFMAAEAMLARYPNTYTGVRDAFVQARGKADTVILGSSTAMSGIDLNAFSPPAASLANISQGLEFHDLLLRRHAGDIPNLDTVVICMDYFTLGYRMVESGQAWRSDFYGHFWDVRSPHRSPSLKSISLFWLYGPRKSMSFIVGKASPLAPDGNDADGKREDEPWHSNPAAAGQRMDKHEKLIRARDYPRNADTLDRLLSDLSRKGVRTFLVRMPVHRSYAELTDPEREAGNREIMHRLRRKHGCVLLDYSRDTRFVDDDFYDPDHLSSSGRNRFMAALLSDMARHKGHVACRQDAPAGPSHGG